MTDSQELEKLLDEINQNAEEIRNKKTEVKDSDLPSNLNIMLSGISDSKAINFLFSNNIDKLIEKLLALANSGDIDKLLSNEEVIKQFFKVLGFGEGSFEGKISKTVISSIRSSVDSAKFNKTKSSMKKAILVVKNLERAKQTLSSAEEKKKYDDTIYSIKKIFRLIAKIYKDRRVINNRVISGLSNIVNESESLEVLETIEY